MKCNKVFIFAIVIIITIVIWRILVGGNNNIILPTQKLLIDTKEEKILKNAVGVRQVILSKIPKINTKITLNEIPKRIIFCGNNKLLTNAVKNNVMRVKNMNKDYTFEYYSDENMNKFMNENFKGYVADAYNKIQVGVSRADFFRYCVVYKRGGIYLDLKSSNKPDLPFNQIIKPTDRFLFGKWKMYRGGVDSEKTLFRPGTESVDYPENHQRILCKRGVDIEGGEYCQWFVIASEGHPYLKRVIDYISTLINEVACKEKEHSNILFSDRLGVLFTTGPIAYTYAIGKIDLTKKSPLHRYMGIVQDPEFPLLYNAAYLGNDRERFGDLTKNGHKPYYLYKGPIAK